MIEKAAYMGDRWRRRRQRQAGPRRRPANGQRARAHTHSGAAATGGELRYAALGGAPRGWRAGICMGGHVMAGRIPPCAVELTTTAPAPPRCSPMTGMSQQSLGSPVCTAVGESAAQPSHSSAPSWYCSRPLSSRPLSSRPLSSRPLSSRPLSSRPLSSRRHPPRAGVLIRGHRRRTASIEAGSRPLPTY
jgi:hypothetical protein